MRISETSGAISARAIAGTYVVLFGISLKADAIDDLLGFSIERLDQSTGEQVFLDNFLLFEQNDTGPDADHSSELNPFQAFVWGDYTVKPDHAYTYSISSRHGTPGHMSIGDTVKLEVKTESVSDGEHAIFFNRGAASSQAYATRFPALHGKAPTGEARTWLSRGLEEAILDFIGQAEGPEWALRASIYEFQYQPVLEAFKAAAARGADVKVIWDDIDNEEDQPATSNAAAIEAAGIEGITLARKNSKYISHNKFIVLLKDGEPQQVWTGSTNITDGGIFGHSNVGHQVRDKKIAAHYLGYWSELSADPAADPLKDWTAADTVAPDLTPEAMLGLADPRPADGQIRTVFSPRHGLKALQWYAKLMDGATSSVFLTAAFGVSKQLRAIFEEDKDYLRYLMLDNRNGKIDTVARGIEKADSDNQVVAGAYIGKGKAKGGWRQWVEESLTGLNNHVQFIHTKYMLIDPLGDDPTVITGSANFSPASTDENDENMLVIRGDTRVADIYLGEFMRLFTAFRLRAHVNAAPDELVPVAGVAAEHAADKKYLKDDSSWAAAAYVPASPEEKERLLFSGS